MNNSDQDLWNRVRERLKSNVGDDIFNSWFARMELEAIEGDTVRLSVPTRFLKSWVQSHYADRLLACWQEEVPTVTRIELTVRSAVLKPLPPKPKAPEVAPSVNDKREIRTGVELPRAAAPISAVHDALGGSPLDPRLSFETFVVGRSNTLAHAAAKQVAQGRRGDPVMFNPLYIHAGVGLGKTHLLQSLAWAGNATAERDVRLILLALLGGALRGVEIGPAREALNALLREIAVGHRMPQHGDPQPGRAQALRQPPRDDRLAAAGSHRCDRDHRQRRFEHCPVGTEQNEIGAARERTRRQMHHVIVRNVAIGEHHLVDGVAAAQRLKLGFIYDVDAVGIVRSGQHGRIAAAGNAGNLRRSECHHLGRRLVPIHDVEIMEIAAGGADNDDASSPRPCCAFIATGWHGSTPIRHGRLSIRSMLPVCSGRKSGDVS